jgi:16S rRNA (guanine527-N7)-methyltransferase
MDREPLPTRVSGLAPLPPEYAEALDLGLASISMAPLAAEARTAIDDHVRLLLAWNDAINLSGIREAVRIATEHVIDSLIAVPLFRAAGIDQFVDLGSGGGYPGIPLALALPARQALLVESIGKKARFLEITAEALGVSDRIEVAPVRAEDLAANPDHRGLWPAVVARAVSDLTDLAELALPLLAPGGLLVAWKRVPLDEELAAAEKAVPQLGGRVSACVAVTVPGLEDHVLAVDEKVAATPPEFPRDPAARRRRPLAHPSPSRSLS